MSQKITLDFANWTIKNYNTFIKLYKDQNVEKAMREALLTVSSWPFDVDPEESAVDVLNLISVLQAWSVLTTVYKQSQILITGDEPCKNFILDLNRWTWYDMKQFESHIEEGDLTDDRLIELLEDALVKHPYENPREFSGMNFEEVAEMLRSAYQQIQETFAEGN